LRDEVPMLREVGPGTARRVIGYEMRGSAVVLWAW